VNKYLKILIAVIAISVYPTRSVIAGIIENSWNTGITQIFYFQPIGESFIAQDAHVMASLYYTPINPGYTVSDLTLSLYQGEGIGGSLLASDTFSLPLNFSGFYNSDFSGVSLAVGHLYSIVAYGGNSPYWGAGMSDDTAGHVRIESGIVNPDATNAFAFRITPVPEPATLALMSLGLAVMRIRISRHRSTLAAA
jgi:hypothetical protein